jgi:hypothetical protein
MAELVKNDKGFKVIKLSAEEASKLGWGIDYSGECICTDCNELISGDIYYVIVLNDTMCKECYEEWYKKAVNYAEDRGYEERVFKNISKLLGL